MKFLPSASVGQARTRRAYRNPISLQLGRDRGRKSNFHGADTMVLRIANVDNVIAHGDAMRARQRAGEGIAVWPVTAQPCSRDGMYASVTQGNSSADVVFGIRDIETCVRRVGNTFWAVQFCIARGPAIARIAFLTRSGDGLKGLLHRS